MRTRWALARGVVAAGLMVLTACTGSPARPASVGVEPATEGRPRAAPAPVEISPAEWSPAEASTRAAAAIVQENQRPGNSGWGDIDGAGPAVVEGFADQPSALPGEPVTLYVTATVPTWTVHAFRLGWYAGARAREVWQSGPQRGVVQPVPTPDPKTHLVQTHWAPSLTLDTTAWPAGDYLLRLDPPTGAKRRFLPLALRSPTTQGALVLVNANTTWQAYNKWGGYSTYAGVDERRTTRARVVSFDRPYDYGSGAADLLGELPVLALAEKLGLPVAYVTDLDLHRQPGLLDGAAGVISLIHDEYYSPEMRAALTKARDAGTNIAFLGANAVFRKIRFLPSPLGPNRQMVNYKDATDPIADRSQVTTQWRLPPSNAPENSLTGTTYQCNPVRGDLVVVDPGSWLFAGLDVTAGTRLRGLLGSEYDRAVVDSTSPRPLQVLAHSPVTCEGTADFQDSAYYTHPSGAGVFNSGTSDWATGIALDPPHPTDTQRIVTGATTTLLQTFAGGPAGRLHPAVDTADRYRR